MCKHGVVLLTEMETLSTVKNMLVKKFVYLAMGGENALNLQQHLPHLSNPLLIRRHAVGLRRGDV